MDGRAKGLPPGTEYTKKVVITWAEHYMPGGMLIRARKRPCTHRKPWDKILLHGLTHVPAVSLPVPPVLFDFDE